MGMMKEFKEFAMKGNLVDIAVGFVMGAAFTKIVTVFTQNMVAPLISMLTEKVRFDQMEWVLREEVLGPDGAVATAKVAVSYGMFLTALIDFIIVAFVMFMVVKSVNRMKKAEPAPPPPGPSNEEKLLMEIRDALKK
ncbi:MAG TPA: large-conductance mechanosensitive channel protein MscL [Flavobacteriales bacterium]|nr:large-conductance mechanosensitive channel protein MscL [Flavobacteriales bacterium]